MLGPNLASWLKMSKVSAQTHQSDKIKKKTKQKRSRNGVECKIKII